MPRVFARMNLHFGYAEQPKNHPFLLQRFNMVLPHSVHLTSVCVGSGDQRLGCRPLHTRHVDLQLDGQAKPPLADRPEADSCGHRRALDRYLGPARHALERIVEAGRVAAGEELLGVCARATRPAEL